MPDNYNLDRRLELAGEIGYRRSCDSHALWCVQRALAELRAGFPAIAERLLIEAEGELTRAQNYPGLRLDRAAASEKRAG